MIAIECDPNKVTAELLGTKAPAYLALHSGSVELDQLLRGAGCNVTASNRERGAKILLALGYPVEQVGGSTREGGIYRVLSPAQEPAPAIQDGPKNTDLEDKAVARRTTAECKQALADALADLPNWPEADLRVTKVVERCRLSTAWFYNHKTEHNRTKAALQRELARRLNDQGGDHSTTASPTASPTEPRTEPELAELRQKVATLEAQLAAAQAQQPTPSQGSAATVLRGELAGIEQTVVDLEAQIQQLHHQRDALLARHDGLNQALSLLEGDGNQGDTAPRRLLLRPAEGVA